MGERRWREGGGGEGRKEGTSECVRGGSKVWVRMEGE